MITSICLKTLALENQNHFLVEGGMMIRNLWVDDLLIFRENVNCSVSVRKSIVKTQYGGVFDS